MKSSIKPLLSLSLVAVLGFGLVGCNNDTPTPEPTSKPTASSTQSAAPTSTPTQTSTAKPTESATDAPVPVKGELEQAQAAFPNPDVVQGATKEEAQLVLNSASRYIKDIYNSGYVTNGSWFANGADAQELVNLYGQYWSDTYRAKVEALVNTVKTEPEPTLKAQAENDLLLSIFFYDNSNKAMKLPDSCNQNNQGAASCLKGGSITDITLNYTKNKEGVFYVGATFTANVKFVKDGKQGISPVKYDVQLEMIKNPYPDAENLRYAYIVNDIGGQWNINNWQEGE